MSFIEKAKFMWDPTGAVVKLIKEWEPKTLKTETQYEKSLYDYLHDNLEAIQVTKQYAKGRIRADIVVNDNVIIEMKNNLDTTGKLQRLVGQLDTYKKWDGDIIILLCGKTEANIKKELKKTVKELNDELAVTHEPVVLIEKG